MDMMECLGDIGNMVELQADRMPGEIEALAFTDSYKHVECLGGIEVAVFTSSLFLKNGRRYCFWVRRCIRRLRGCFALYLGCY